LACFGIFIGRYGDILPVEACARTGIACPASDCAEASPNHTPATNSVAIVVVFTASLNMVILNPGGRLTLVI
jgi:hypothetical protein